MTAVVVRVNMMVAEMGQLTGSRMPQQQSDEHDRHPKVLMLIKMFACHPIKFTATSSSSRSFFGKAAAAGGRRKFARAGNSSST